MTARDSFIVDTRTEISELEWCANWCKANNLSPYDKANWAKAKAEWSKQ